MRPRKSLDTPSMVSDRLPRQNAEILASEKLEAVVPLAFAIPVRIAAQQHGVTVPSYVRTAVAERLARDGVPFDPTLPILARGPKP